MLEIFNRLQQRLSELVLGQEHLIHRLLIALLSNGHLLLEGAPGLAKTRAVKMLATCLDCSFQRIQFTPDLLPADISGSDIYLPETHEFEFRPGPVFHQLILADEINRAPAKVQSALLEAMEEHQVTVGGRTYQLPQPFLVIATRNPIEQEGTYPLPEAQLDRFLMHCPVGYPSREAELGIIHLTRHEAINPGASELLQPLVTPEDLAHAVAAVHQIQVAESVEQYIVELVRATRTPERWAPQLSQCIAYGASPRGAIALERSARAYAWLQGRDFVTPTDIQTLAPDVLRHRLVLDYRAETEGIDADQIIAELLVRVPVA